MKKSKKEGGGASFSTSKITSIDGEGDHNWTSTTTSGTNYAKSSSQNVNLNAEHDNNVLTLITKVETHTKPLLTTKNIFRIFRPSEKRYSTSQCSGGGGDIKIYIKNENHINNFECRGRGTPRQVEPVIMTSSTPNSMSSPRKPTTSTSKNRSESPYQTKFPPQKPKKYSDTTLTYESVVNYNNQTLKKDYFVLPRRRKKDGDESSTPIRNQPPQVTPRKLVNKRVQTEIERPKTPLNMNSNYTNSNTSNLILPKLAQTTSIGENSQSASNNFNKKQQQESSNFSLFKGMNSNDLGNYIDNVINQFRLKAKLTELAEPPDTAKADDFSNDIFYPEDHRDDGDLAERTATNVAPTNRTTNVNDSVQVIATDRSNFHDASSTRDNLLESRSFTHTPINVYPDAGGADDDENSTFINYTHSIELEDDITSEIQDDFV